MDISNYINLITSEHKTKPRFIKWLSASLNIIGDAIDSANSINENYDIDKAIGSQLDVLGEIIGRKRLLTFQPTDGVSSLLTDDYYRLILKSKIAQNNWDGTMETIYTLWNNIFGDREIFIVDNQNMTMSVYLGGQLDLFISQLVTNGYIIPKPQSVGIIVIALTNSESLVYSAAVITTADNVVIKTTTM